jgi:hypothetical protein
LGSLCFKTHGGQKKPNTAVREVKRRKGRSKIAKGSSTFMVGMFLNKTVGLMGFNCE